MSWCGFDDVAQEFLALFSTLHDFTGGLYLLCMLWSVWRVIIFLILVTHGLFSLCGGVSEPLSNIELSGKLIESASVKLMANIFHEETTLWLDVRLTCGYYQAEFVICVALNVDSFKLWSIWQEEDACKNTHHQWCICVCTIFQIIQ